ncbi:MAG TPA: HAMP domain-containing sensor histidine kinase [Amnibacterium sp.]|nr:HAMP domain-containing sensor histidine kinase [Amnibacterium sp.]
MTAEPLVRPAFRRRIVAATALVSTIGMGVLVFLVIVVTGRSTDREIQTGLSARTAAVLATTSYSHGVLHVADVNDALYDTFTWVFDKNGRRIEGPTIPIALRAAVEQRARSTSTGITEAEQWRIDAAPLIFSGRRVGRAVVALDAKPYDSVIGKTAAASAVFGVAVIMGTCLLAWLIVGRALAPVAAMTRTAAAWSESRLDRRFGLGPPRDEITGLGAVLDSLLERVGAAIRAEQRLTAELAHELRTPLTVIRGEAQLGRSTRGIRDRERDRFGRIEAAAVDMATAMTTLLDVARGATGANAASEMAPALAAVVGRHPEARPAIEVRVEPPDLTVPVPGELVERIVAPLVDNAVRHASTAVRLSARSEAGVAVVRVENDGPAVVVPADSDLFVPGVRGGDSPGAGLGLALSRRIARSVGGDVVLERADPPIFAVTLPGGPAPVAPGVSALASVQGGKPEPMAEDERPAAALPAPGPAG